MNGKETFRIALTAYSQVTLTTIATWAVAHNLFLGALIASWSLNYIWTKNVKRAAFGSNRDSLIYATSASLGTLTGMKLAPMLKSLTALI